jgi:uncharacterized protein YqeY
MARAALRCDIETALSEDQVVAIFTKTLSKRRRIKEYYGASRWDLVDPPDDERAAVQWVPNPREERQMAADGWLGAAASARVGAVVALGFNGSGSADDGRTVAHLFTATVMKSARGKVVGAGTIRKQMKRVEEAVVKADPTARATHSEDPA